MNTRKAVLSAMSMVASLAMFASTQAESKGEAKNSVEVAPVTQTNEVSAQRAENQAIVKGAMEEMGSACTARHVERVRKADEKWREEVARVEKEREAREKREREEEAKHANEGCRECREEVKCYRQEAEDWYRFAMDLRKELKIKNEEIAKMRFENQRRKNLMGALYRWGAIAAVSLLATWVCMCGSKSKNRQVPCAER